MFCSTIFSFLSLCLHPFPHGCHMLCFACAKWIVISAGCPFLCLCEARDVVIVVFVQVQRTKVAGSNPDATRVPVVTAPHTKACGRHPTTDTVGCRVVCLIFFLWSFLYNGGLQSLGKMGPLLVAMCPPPTPGCGRRACVRRRTPPLPAGTWRVEEDCPDGIWTRIRGAGVRQSSTRASALCRMLHPSPVKVWECYWVLVFRPCPVAGTTLVSCQ